MKVERIDLYDFKVMLGQDDFDKLKRLAEQRDTSIEQEFIRVFCDGLYDNLKDLW